MSDIVNWPADQSLPENILKALKILLDSGEIIVYPTNTLYGIGASIYSEPGIKKVHEAKNRPDNVPFLVMATEAQIRELCIIPDIASPFFERQDILVTAIFLGKNVPVGVQHNNTLAVRLPCSELTEYLVDYVGPVTSTSANIHGKVAPTNCQEAESQLGEDISVYIDSGEMGGIPSTLIDFTGEKPKVIREGVLSLKDVRNIYG